MVEVHTGVDEFGIPLHALVGVNRLRMGDLMSGGAVIHCVLREEVVHDPHDLFTYMGLQAGPEQVIFTSSGLTRLKAVVSGDGVAQRCSCRYAIVLRYGRFLRINGVVCAAYHISDTRLGGGGDVLLADSQVHTT